jgi:hypothetical protein
MALVTTTGTRSAFGAVRGEELPGRWLVVDRTFIPADADG